MTKRGLLNGTFLSGSSASCYADEFAPFSLCSIEGEGGDGGAGGGGSGGGAAGAGAAGLLDGDPPPADGGQQQEQQQQEQQSGGGAPPAWAAELSGDVPGEGQASNRDYIASKNFADPDTLVQSYRELEKQLHGGKGYVKVPGEGAKPEEIAAYRTALGVPEKAEDYKVNLPAAKEGEIPLELDNGFLDPMRAAAHKAGVPAAAFEQLGEAFVTWQLDQVAGDVRESDAEHAAQVKLWGNEAPAKTQDFRRGAELLGLKRDDVIAWQNARLPDGSRVGAGRVMERLAALGALAGEDTFQGGGGKPQFGVASAAEAQAQIDKMIADPAIAAKVRTAGSAEAATYNRLNDAISAFNARDAARRGK